MVDLDSDPTKLIEVVAIGKQLLMTRGALTTFSIANDVAKYFTTCPRCLRGRYLAQSDRRDEPALPIVDHPVGRHLQCADHPLLIPIALEGVQYRAWGEDALLRRDLLIWGLGDVVPAVEIKVIDMVMVALRLVA